VKYRSDIDGLRAVAVIPVVLFHMGFPLFQAGFLGVDVFFVISGFLITKILLNDNSTGFSFILNFYDRRARRIFPALFFIIALSIVFAWFLMVPSQIKDFGQSVLAALAFSSNIYFWLKLDYWGQSAEFIPLLHLWSLAVEEQFYLIFPFVLLIVNTQRKLKTCLILIIVTSFVSMAYMFLKGYSSEAFYLPFFRAWELALGAYAATFNTSKIKPKLANALSIIGAIMLLTSLVVFNSNTNYALLYSIPVVGSFLIILFNQPGLLIARVLSNRALVFIGLVSYSLYLVHQPVLAFSRVYLAGSLDVFQNLICLILIIALSLFSYRYIEKPFRSKKLALSSRFYIGIFCIIVLFGAFGLSTQTTNGFNDYKLAQMPEQKARMIERLTEESKKRGELAAEYDLVRLNEFENDGRKRILFVGDSVSGDLYAAAAASPIEKIAEIRSVGLHEECYGVDKLFPTCEEDVANFSKSTLLSDADIIIVGNSFLPDNVGSLENFMTFGNVRDKKVILFAQHQFMDINSLVMLGDKFNYDYTSKKLSKFVYNNRHERTLESNRLMERFASKNKLNVINGFDFFCDDVLMECKLFNDDSVPMLLDIVHVTPTGFNSYSPWFYDELIQLIEDQSQNGQ
jgi:peptidoglycan/LPS O-acetylase OafA/YrhL